MEQTSMTFINNLKHIMDERNISQHELSRETGIPQSSISGYIKCKNAPLLKQALKICEYLNTSIDEMCGHNINNQCTETKTLTEELNYYFTQLNYEGKFQLLSIVKSLVFNPELKAHIRTKEERK